MLLFRFRDESSSLQSRGKLAEKSLALDNWVNLKKKLKIAVSISAEYSDWLGIKVENRFTVEAWKYFALRLIMY